MDAMAARFAPQMLSVLRIMVGLVLLAWGTAKLLGFPELGRPGPAFLSLVWFAGAIELVGGALLLVGLFTRPVAFVLAGSMAFAYFIGHWPRGITPIANGGTAAYLFCFVSLYLAAAGAGPWSVDARAGSRR